ncbi:Gfo/Idh/MocA family oxidoreductase [Paenibacillus mesophilus]|uniref:Gfo/Idh/MocA family protein n=1 Tax=Paenibacillus mesophilus TaxID=2582849 RepID=UPI00110F2CA5|nr:Gfo/Idh/MocA family oxidoreductase [Paenibacillus mesophilus]TMV47373.1 Gfo/Idh/MocA family oxidoreductase [Paenibacillus mesophilus]
MKHSDGTDTQRGDTGNTLLKQKPVRAVIVGAGHRSMLYASYSVSHADELHIAGVVEPDEVRRKVAMDAYKLPPEHGYESIEQLIAGPRIADVVFNGTMDHLHVATTLPLLEAGYDVLLEKPIGVSEKEVRELLETANRLGRKVMICHELRYAPFYAEIRKRLLQGAIGEVINMQFAENVSYHHIASAYVRGKWNSQKRGGSSMLMAKCCHDLDLMVWMKAGVQPKRVSSMGGRMFFREEQKPEGAGTRCLVDCPLVDSCAYSAKAMYLERNLWGTYVWHGIEHLSQNPTEEQKRESLRTDNPYGRCVWASDNDVVDHQAVNIEFADGCTGTFSLNGNAAKPGRRLHLIGTHGEIEGVMEEGSFTIRHFDLSAGHGYREERVNVDVTDNMHGGGDMRLVSDFLRVIRGEQPSISTTTLADSVNGHFVGFAADRSRVEQQWVQL